MRISLGDAQFYINYFYLNLKLFFLFKLVLICIILFLMFFITHVAFLIGSAPEGIILEILI